MSRYAKLAAGSGALLVSFGLGTAMLGGSAAAMLPLRAPAASGTKPPLILRGGLLQRRPGTVSVGTLVKPSGLGQRVFISAKVGFALGSVGQAQYPAKTTDGGAVWKTFGPALHIDAAQAPLSVGDIGVADAQTIFFYGGGQVVDATGDGGRHWWQALTDGLSAAVAPFGDHLLWFTQNQAGNGTATWVYSSNDGGKVWHYTTAIGG